MIPKEYIHLANQIKDCAMATIESGQPRVRMMGLWFADDSGFYFQAWTFKGVFRQLKENPAIEICFISQDKKTPHTMMRVRGVIEFLEDKELKEKLWQDRQFLKNLGALGPDDPRLVIFRIAHGQASLWPIKKAGEYPGIAKIEF